METVLVESREDQKHEGPDGFPPSPSLLVAVGYQPLAH